MVYNLRKRKNPPPMEKEETDNDNASCSDTESDSDYCPDEDSSEYEEDDDMTEEEDEEEMIDFAALGRNYRAQTQSPILILPLVQNALQRNASMSKMNYNTEEKAYLKNLDKDIQKELIEKEKKLDQILTKDAVPLRFKILNSCLDEGSKHLILTKLEQFQHMNDSHGEYFKLKNWLHNVCMLPIQKYCYLPITYQNPICEIQGFMNETKRILDDTVYGHLEAKNQILRIIAQWISNPNSHGHCIGIQGPAGIGKTTLVKEGIAKALKMPFGFIALGGASDGSFLEGHSFTYEGSTYGKIAELLIRTQCMNPILFFDELDKVSTTNKGEEIIGILTHLTDASQNEKFNDKYFGEIDLNLSRALIVFSYNDESLINPILKDRLITIHVKGYSNEDKFIIATQHLLPTILKNYGFQANDIVFPKETIYQIIQMVPEEEGVRNLKRGIECIISWINMYRYLPQDEPIQFPYIVSNEIIHKFIKTEKENKMLSMYM
jgi:ATP-dependent Lon protease